MDGWSFIYFFFEINNMVVGVVIIGRLYSADTSTDAGVSPILVKTRLIM
jgi:hypothetical protein